MWRRRIKPEGCSVSFTPHHGRQYFYADFFAGDGVDSFIDTYSSDPNRDVSEEVFLEQCANVAHLIASGANRGEVACLVPGLRRR